MNQNEEIIKYKKYKKYKQKYLNLKGGQKLFENYKLSSDSILYHGTYSLILKMNDVTFFTPDIIQSLGFILKSNYFNIGPYTDITTDLIYKLFSFYPTIYECKTNSNLNLLKINKSIDDISDINTFGVLINTEMLYKYFIKIDNCIDKLINFIDFYNISFENNKEQNNLYELQSSHTPIYETENIIDYKNGTISFKNLFIKLINKLKIECIENCMGSDTNTMIYNLLYQIDYKNYIKELGLSEYDIDGIYQEHNANEIIIFDSNLLSINNRYYILPYYLKKYESEDPDFAHKIYINFIKYYFNLSTNLPQNYDIIDLHKLFLSYFQLFNQASYTDKTIKWNFTTYYSTCINYNIEDISCNTATLCQHRVNASLYTLNPNVECRNKHVYKSIKFSIENLDLLPQLYEYIDFIKSCDTNKFQNIEKIWNAYVNLHNL
jgi:hypothetical protein